MRLVDYLSRLLQSDEKLQKCSTKTSIRSDRTMNMNLLYLQTRKLERQTSYNTKYTSNLQYFTTIYLESQLQQQLSAPYNTIRISALQLWQTDEKCQASLPTQHFLFIGFLINLLNLTANFPCQHSLFAIGHTYLSTMLQLWTAYLLQTDSYAPTVDNDIMISKNLRTSRPL